jgi:hypothetical protein
MLTAGQVIEALKELEPDEPIIVYFETREGWGSWKTPDKRVSAEVWARMCRIVFENEYISEAYGEAIADAEIEAENEQLEEKE